MTPTTLPKTPPISAVDYFSAKLDYEMTPWTLKAQLDRGAKDCLVLDVREPQSYAQGHIPGAQSIPLSELPAKLSALPKNKTIVTYCGNITCQLAPKAALELAQKGFKVRELFGGIEEWSKRGFPVEKA